MEVVGWIVLATVLGGLYFLWMAIYKLSLNVRKLVSEGAKLKQMLETIRNPAETKVTPATPSSRQDYVQLVTKRTLLKRRRLAAAQARERRLIERIRFIDLDKRKK